MYLEPGTVSAMFPSPPVILLQSDNIVAVARAMAGNRTDGNRNWIWYICVILAVLVVDSSQKLVGIVTDKDLAFRCVSEGLEAYRTPVSKIMTKFIIVYIYSSDMI